MDSTEIREKFLRYFEQHGHTRVKSSSLIPAADPTLLFTNAGMVQFKDSFLGLTDMGYKRATTAQKCVRAGGKHNDLENVGFTPRHHTFFEMLGNFSFGDYFKKNAIAFAWELLTKHYALPKDKLRITIYEKDDEAGEIWKAQGIRPDWIYKLGEKDNFWAMGDTGPCGPCTEIYFDWGPKYGCGKPDCNPGCPCGLRFLEIWNLVFMQFNRDSRGSMLPLPKPSVDTGAGLERVTSVLQGTYNNYDNDLFKPLIQSIAAKVGKTYGENADNDVALRVIADHLRSCGFLLADGVTPSNEGRGYVLRRILRRAIRYGKKLGQESPFLFDLVDTLSSQLGDQYPEMRENLPIVKTLMKEEEERFHETIHRGIGVLEDALRKASKEKSAVLPGDVVFKLYDSFGFPVDLVEVIARENQMTIDEKGFHNLMEKQRAQSVWKGDGDIAFTESISKVLETKKVSPTFTGYDSLSSASTLAILFDRSGKEVKELSEDGFAVFDQTPFYAESGGQVGDKGKLSSAEGTADVLATTKIAKVIVHKIQVTQGKVTSGARCQLEVDPSLRKQTAINHTATHLLHAALRNVLGDRVKQAGSLVEPKRLRFDFTFPRGLNEEEIRRIETVVNEEIQKSQVVSTKEMPYDEAIQSGALAFFDEKYGDKVRVIRVGGEKPFSVELCGGTHLNNVNEIGLFKVTSESSVASGVRRIEAITSKEAFAFLNRQFETVKRLEAKLGVTSELVEKKVDELVSSLKSTQKEMESLKLKVAQGAVRGTSQAKSNLETINGIKAVIESVPGADAKILRTLVDQFRDKNKEKTIVVLASDNAGKAALCVGLTKDLLEKFDASKIVKELAPEVGGTGGGRNDFAQAGGTNPAGIPKAFDRFRNWLKDHP